MVSEDRQELVRMRKVVMQLIADYYLITNGKKSFSEEYPEKEDIYSEPNLDQLMLNRAYLEKKYQEKGMDLKTEIEKNGEQMNSDNLTNYEYEILIKKADEFLIMLGLLEERKALKKD